MRICDAQFSGWDRRVRIIARNLTIMAYTYHGKNYGIGSDRTLLFGLPGPCFLPGRIGRSRRGH